MTSFPPVISDSYMCATCGQTVFTTLGQHFCPGHRITSRPAPIITTKSNTFLWNGPVCDVCGKYYIGSHTCPGSETEHLKAENDTLREEIERLRRKLRKAKRHV